MRSVFPLFQSHLDLAHAYWERILQKGDIAIDATCGNGADSLLIAKKILDDNFGFLYVMDIQEKALHITNDLLLSHLPENLVRNVHFLKQSHETFPKDLKQNSVKLIVYNLGYLPGGDKTITTHTSSTLTSLMNALPLLCDGGAISITCYPGHEEGAIEEKEILQLCQSLNPFQWNCCFHQWPNRKKSPSLLFLQKSIAPY